MATKTFSSRVDAEALAFADALTQKEYGLSYGQYCGTLLLKTIERTGKMPALAVDETAGRKRRAADFIKGFANREHDKAIGELSDDGIRDLIASRYE